MHEAFQSGALFLKELADSLVWIHHKRLLYEDYFLVEFLHAANNHLLNDIVWLAAFTCLLGQNTLLGFNDCRIQLIGRCSGRRCGSNVHRNLATDVFQIT